MTLQGEGANAGRRAIFVRLAGCNGWSGRAEDRPRGPFVCSAWCDTDFRGTDGRNGGVYDAPGLAGLCGGLWGADRRHRFAVLTGGEPMLQVDPLLVDTLHRFGFKVAVETNGTRPCPDSLDWVTVSPKAGADLVQTTGSELKVVYPQEGLSPEQFEGMAFGRFWLQPRWSDDPGERAENMRAAVRYCLANPGWRLSLQGHKYGDFDGVAAPSSPPPGPARGGEE